MFYYCASVSVLGLGVSVASLGVSVASLVVSVAGLDVLFFFVLGCFSFVLWCFTFGLGCFSFVLGRAKLPNFKSEKYAPLIADLSKRFVVSFLDAFTHLYKRLCPLVHPSVGHTQVEFLRNGRKSSKIASGTKKYII